MEFRDKILLKGEECKNLENPNFMRKGKMVILVKKCKNFIGLG